VSVHDTMFVVAHISLCVIDRDDDGNICRSV
jgi:hypothetical protein